MSMYIHRFNGTSLSFEDLSSLDGKHIKVVISTVPGQANITLPSNILEYKPIVLDVVYKPSRTSLLQQAIDMNCPIVQGATMLLEQGIEQFELWNRRRAPRDEMEKAVFDGIEKLSNI